MEADEILETMHRALNVSAREREQVALAAGVCIACFDAQAETPLGICPYCEDTRSN